MPGKHGVNSIIVGACELLLTAGGGVAVHPTGLAADADTAQSAVPGHVFEPDELANRPGLSHYDPEALLAPRWAAQTLCGRQWREMVGGDGGPISVWDAEAQFAPTCKRCLAVLDTMFPPPPPHPMLGLVTRVVADLVAEQGYAEISGVPGDQQTQLRRLVRTTVRGETGHPCQTLVADSRIYVICEPICDLHQQEHMAEARDAIETAFRAAAPQDRPDPPWRVWWSTWAGN